MLILNFKNISHFHVFCDGPILVGARKISIYLQFQRNKYLPKLRYICLLKFLLRIDTLWTHFARSKRILLNEEQFTFILPIFKMHFNFEIKLLNILFEYITIHTHSCFCVGRNKNYHNTQTIYYPERTRRKCCFIGPSKLPLYWMVKYDNVGIISISRKKDGILFPGMMHYSFWRGLIFICKVAYPKVTNRTLLRRLGSAIRPSVCSSESCIILLLLYQQIMVKKRD